MSCYRNGGCGPYEQLSCTECPASRPEYAKAHDTQQQTHTISIYQFHPELIAEGVHVFLAPYGNFVRLHQDEALTEAIITSVKRKYFYVAARYNGTASGTEWKFSKEGGSFVAKDEYNGEYVIWMSRADYQSYITRSNKLREIKNFFRLLSDMQANKLMDEDIDTIHNIINIRTMNV